MTQNELHKTFIAMLFAFVASTVGQQIAEILVVLTNNWTIEDPSGIIENIYASNWLLASAASHSALALLLFSMSWVMWSKSQAAGHKRDIEDIFSIKYITLLLEVLLVTLYFAISKSAEADFAAYGKEKLVSDFVKNPSAKPEAMQIVWVFVLFAAWDYLSDVFTSPRNPAPNSMFVRVWTHIPGVLTYCSVSIFCALVAWSLSKVTPLSGLPQQAVLGDIALVSLVLFFSRAKSLEYYLLQLFPGEQGRDNTARLNPPTMGRLVLIIVLVVVFVISTVGMVYFPCYLK
ncbi:hypothetical protein VVF04_08555 [Pseudomonas aeruginosa]|uniref:hypothetical protein n=1 Tax=Pseudomonas aeruginosa TaxID=287 RepID=UPI0003B9E254|nr:hypothetical protein [Pseudomonas aeruginosa]EKU2241706.1 hypothetical protein [Pseudomonas aeruginosa]ELK4810692.1 hypothetical protein [Pseudomonas aeruginosa]ELS4618672.1 hypothetical protein [Pseudomonas aeruginosa]ERW34159.1 hypothetical protein Q033_04293 [Pseudomonas aeruginosa BWHPSA020]MBO7946395.1 hypothetical protein [Pseudomonas aeruginosa]